MSKRRKQRNATRALITQPMSRQGPAGGPRGPCRPSGTRRRRRGAQMTRAAHRAQQQLGQSLLLEICKASLPVLLIPWSRLQQNIWSARRSEPRDLWPNAQPAPRLHRRTSFCLREQAVSTLYVPKLGSALCSTPAASWLPRSRTRPSRQRRCICSTY